MLKEHKHVKQQEDGKTRRWFSDNDFDLIVWIEKDRDIYGFQLCYDKQKLEHSLTWRKNKGFTHEKIDSGESEPLSYKMSPMMIPDGDFDVNKILNRFKSNAVEIDGKIARFVTQKLVEFSGKN